MKKKTVVSLIILIVILFTSYLLQRGNNHPFLISQEKIKIAACPTCYELAKKLDTQKYQVIATTSTVQSISLLQDGQVNMILAGRTLKPSEPKLNEILIEDGFSFLHDKQIALYEKELENYSIYTDLDPELIKAKFNVEDVLQVNNVYEYLDKGVVVTSWKNTDYTKAEIVHLLKEDGERLVLARRPTVFCPNACGVEAEEVADFIKSDLKTEKGGDNL